MSLADHRRTHVLWAIGVGALLEIVVLWVLLPKGSLEPPTPFGKVLAYTQVPGGAALFLLLATGIGPALDNVPVPLAAIVAFLGIAMLFVLQSAVMGIPVWLTLRAWQELRSRPATSDSTSGDL